MEAVATSADLGLPLDTTWSTAPMSSTPSLQTTHYSMVITPPPEVSGFPPAYPYPAATPLWQDYTLPPNQPIASTMASTMAPTSMQTTLTDCYLNGSSLVYSPLSSPGSAESNLSTDDMSYGQPTMITSSKSPSPLCYNVYSHANVPSGYEPSPAKSSFSPTMAPPGLESKNGIDFGLSGKFSKEPRMPQSKLLINIGDTYYLLRIIEMNKS